MYMSDESLLIILVVGVIAGWLSGQIVQGTGFGIVGDLLIGIVGTFIGSCATFGALVVLHACRRLLGSYASGTLDVRLALSHWPRIGDFRADLVQRRAS